MFWYEFERSSKRYLTFPFKLYISKTLFGIFLPEQGAKIISVLKSSAYRLFMQIEIILLKSFTNVNGIFKSMTWHSQSCWFTHILSSASYSVFPFALLFQVFSVPYIPAFSGYMYDFLNRVHILHIRLRFKTRKHNFIVRWNFSKIPILFKKKR